MNPDPTSPRALPDHVDVLIAGGGPAGCAVAVGLRAMGYTVSLVHSPRPWHCCEGVSDRTRQGLFNAGLERAAALVPPPTLRRVDWDGKYSEANGERLVLRRSFDRALLDDLAVADVDSRHGRVRRVDRPAGEPVIAEVAPSDGSPRQTLTCDFFVEARGRAAPGDEGDSLRGPDTVSLLQERRGRFGEAGTHVCSFESGWVWLASRDSNHHFVQITVDPGEARLPGRANLADWFEEQLARLPATAAFARATRPEGEVAARGSTSLLRGDVIGERSLRVGDAAMAVDPLSGNGMFQSISSALAAPAVINTLLKRPQSAGLATAFYRGRIKEAFLRFSRTGRDFYRMESRWRESGFWHARAGWPDDEPVHAPDPPIFEGIAPRPVIAAGFIVEQPVAITSERPQGVWQVAGVKLAPLLEALPARPEQQRPVLQKRLAALADTEPRRRESVAAWLRHHRLL